MTFPEQKNGVEVSAAAAWTSHKKTQKNARPNAFGPWPDHYFGCRPRVTTEAFQIEFPGTCPRTMDV